MGNFIEGQTVKYDGKETHIENIFEDGTCTIANPYWDWDWDDEAQCVNDGVEYDTPYWIKVKLSELSV